MADGMLSVSQSFVQSKRHYEIVTESCSVYKRRWYILTIFSLIAGVQAAAWNTWGPITGSAEDVFGWSDGTIALLENWGPIAYIVSFLFFSWLMDVKGMLGYLCGRNTELWYCIILIKHVIPRRASVRFTCSASSASSWIGMYILYSLANTTKQYFIAMSDLCGYTIRLNLRLRTPRNLVLI